jgi:hypothetical protein
MVDGCFRLGYGTRFSLMIKLCFGFSNFQASNFTGCFSVWYQPLCTSHIKSIANFCNDSVHGGRQWSLFSLILVRWKKEWWERQRENRRVNHPHLKRRKIKRPNQLLFRLLNRWRSLMIKLGVLLSERKIQIFRRERKEHLISTINKYHIRTYMYCLLTTIYCPIWIWT